MEKTSFFIKNMTIINNNTSFPLEKLYFITTNIAVYHFPFKVSFPEKRPFKVIYFSKGHIDNNSITIIWNGLKSLGEMENIVLTELKNNLVIFKGEWACFALVYFFFNQSKSSFKEHFLEKLLEFLSRKYPAFKLDDFELKFLMEKEIEVFGKYNKKY